MSMTIPQSYRWVFLNPVCETVVWPLVFMVKNVFEKIKNSDPTDRGMVTGRPGQKPDWKKMTRSVRLWYGLWRVNIRSIGMKINVFNSIVCFLNL